MNPEQIRSAVDRIWDSSIVPTIEQYIRIPNQSPLFDPDWKQNGHMHRAVALARQWVEQQNVAGITIEVHELDGRTPLIFMEIEGNDASTVLMYGHLDKQPAMVGWEEGLGPWTPVLRDGKLYGRGGADDGYAIFATIASIKTLQEQQLAHSRIVVVIECCEESGSVDLPAYIDLLADRIGTPRLVICLDSGCGNYEQLWMTTSLRGSIVGNLTVEVLSEGVHSGDASGIVPSSFRILRKLLERLEDSESGRIVPEWLWIDTPPERLAEAKETARVLGDEVWNKFPFVDGMQPVSKDPLELLLNRTWRPALAYTGQGGFPDLVQGGNVLRPKTSLKLSLRIPPSLDATDLDKRLKQLLESDPPYGAHVTFEPEKGGGGWEAPKTAPWLEESVERASQTYFGKGAMTFGEGGSIPFMGMLGARYPNAQFLITGVLGPHSNAHGPNEFLHIRTAKNLTASVAQVLADEHASGKK
ncbi:MAG: Acetylornithine deacetylase/succinyldiaminopimelate desuccinylase-like deacylase [Acidobacteria bacterium]|nr:Acetylornithine deacetylase/succinyldiaminopimelate desuccinylase-like deacylase [Acidobacteriota bacterium]